MPTKSELQLKLTWLKSLISNTPQPSQANGLGIRNHSPAITVPATNPNSVQRSLGLGIGGTRAARPLQTAKTPASPMLNASSSNAVGNGPSIQQNALMSPMAVTAKAVCPSYKNESSGLQHTGGKLESHYKSLAEFCNVNIPIPKQEQYLDENDRKMNDQLHKAENPKELTSEEELQVFEEFLALEKLSRGTYQDPEGLRGLAMGYYHMEAQQTSIAPGILPVHVSGIFIYRLLEYYKLKIYKTHKISFSKFLALLQPHQICEILGTNPRDSQHTEIMRRFSKGVRYLTSEKLAKYNVTSKNSVLYWAKSGAPLDTEKKDGAFFERKATDPQKDPRSLLRSGDATAIWVLAKNKRLYTHVSKMHRFHHSSFAGGDAIICGGDWAVSKGNLEVLSGNSGHYQPTIDHLATAINVLATDFGISANSYWVLCWNNKSYSMMKVKANHFLFQLPKVRDEFMVVKPASVRFENPMPATPKNWC